MGDAACHSKAMAMALELECCRTLFGAPCSLPSKPVSGPCQFASRLQLNDLRYKIIDDGLLLGSAKPRIAQSSGLASQAVELVEPRLDGLGRSVRWQEQPRMPRLQGHRMALQLSLSLSLGD